MNRSLGLCGTIAEGLIHEITIPNVAETGNRGGKIFEEIMTKVSKIWWKL